LRRRRTPLSIAIVMRNPLVIGAVFVMKL